jgi:hypothetical protein
VHPVQDRNVEQGFLGTCFSHLTKPRIQQIIRISSVNP